MIKENLKPNEVDASTLFVGVGGTGGKIVKAVAEMCKPGETENVNFVCLDTNVNDLSSVAKSGAHIYYVQTSNTQTVGDYLNYDEDALRNWFPKNAVIYDKTVSEGAGQVRAISRLALNATVKVGNLKPLYDAIDDLFRKDGKAMKQATRIVMVSTASGGTGSGIVLPMSMMIRDYVSNKYPNTSLIVRALLLLPETLDGVIESAVERESQRRNAYAAIKEINAFMMKGSGFLDQNEDLKRYSDIHMDFAVPGTDEVKRLALLPFDFCFLMDGQNSQDNTMISMGQYINQAALALYEQNIGPMQKDAFSVEDNIIKELANPGNFGRNRFGGIGAGSLRYPYEEVVKYVAYDWAKDSIGGEGEAAKWTRYDQAFKVKDEELKKKGLAGTERPTLQQTYVELVDMSKDNFTKDLKNTDLVNARKRVSAFTKALTEQVRTMVKNSDVIRGGMQATANMEGYQLAESNRKNAPDDLNKMRNLKISADMNAAKIAANAAEAILRNTNKTASVRDPYMLESLIKNHEGRFVHPNAVRYLLYMAHATFSKMLKEADEKVNSNSEALAIYAKGKKDKNFDLHATKKNEEDTLDALAAAAKAGDETMAMKFGGKEELKKKLSSHFTTFYTMEIELIDAYSDRETCRAALEYIKEVYEEYERFFKTFGAKVASMCLAQDDLVDSIRFKKGDSIYNICSDRDVLKELSFSTRSMSAEGAMLDSDLNAKIFDAVKDNVAFNREIANMDVVEEDRHVDIFDNILLDYFKDSVSTKCKNLDLNIIEAIAMEKRILLRLRARQEQDSGEKVIDKVSPEEIERHIKEMLDMGMRLSAPGIQELRGVEPRRVTKQAYNSSLLAMRNIRVKDLLPKGSAVDSVSKYELHFFNALYNLTPDKLDKFAAPVSTETKNRNAGLYQNAYMNYARNIGPDSTKSALISTHIDKRWDSIAVMPELDFGYQNRRVMKINKAMIYGLLYEAIKYRKLSKVAADKRVYRYENSEERDEELIVSNGTLCDEFYEILDALYISSAIVEDMDIVRAGKEARDRDRKTEYEKTYFARRLKEFKIDLLGMEGPSSLLEIPVVYYNTLPSQKRFSGEIAAMVDAVVDTIREQIVQRASANDVQPMLCKVLMEQYELLMANYEASRELNCDTPADENLVIDHIYRRLRKAMQKAPEPCDYDEIIDKMRSLIKDCKVGK